MDKVDKVVDKAEAKLAEAKPAAKSVWQNVKPFFNGGASGMLATCVIQPIDMVKVRLQLGASGSPVRFPPGFADQCSNLKRGTRMATCCLMVELGVEHADLQRLDCLACVL